MSVTKKKKKHNLVSSSINRTESFTANFLILIFLNECDSSYNTIM